MILSGNKKGGIPKNRSVAFMGLCLLALLALFGLDYWSSQGTQKTRQVEGIFCSAETIEGDDFIHNGYYFGGAIGQNKNHPHSGQYSCQLTAKNRFGLVFTTTDFVKGATYKATIWRFTDSDKGFFVVEGNKESNFKIVEKIAIEEKDGFEKLQIIFNVPSSESMDTLKIYAGVNESTGNVYFDDLHIELLESKQNEASFSPDLLHIKMSNGAYGKFSSQKWKAIKERILFSGDEDRASASLFSKNENKKIPIKLRLKGDWTDHLRGDKWSFRIKTMKESTWNRMRTFSIQNPNTRGFLNEWVFHQLLAKEDILSPRYDFIEVELNDKKLGIYAYEEHFDKQLPESQQRREGPILKLTEDLFWLGMKRQFALQDWHDLYKNKENAFEGSDIRPFKESNNQNSEVLAAEFKTAQTLLHQFKYNLKPASDIFDLPRMAKYIAIMDVLGAYHGKFWHNLRFYYNPISSKLEPVGFDGFGDTETRLKDQIVYGYKINTEEVGDDILKYLFTDEAFFKLYMQQLATITAAGYLERFFADMEVDIAVRQQFLQKEFSSYHFDKDPFIARARSIRLLLNAYSEQSVLVRIQEKKEGVFHLKVSNTHPFPVEIIGYGKNQKEMETTFSTAVFVYSRPQNTAPNYTDIEVPGQAKFLYFKVAGLDSVYVANIVDWPIAGDVTQRQLMFSETPKTNELYEVVDQKILFRKGHYSTKKDINIPAGYKVFFEAGYHLDLQKKAAFISKSPVFLLGTEASPIRIFSSDQTGNGFSVLQAGEVSTINYAHFDHLNTFSKNDWSLTGAVTFFESDVEITNSIFSNNHCEDGLNIVHSSFKLEKSTISNTFSDGFDADFCEGTVHQVVFKQAGNDGMDFSGSVITINDVNIFGAGDKGLSVGENAQVHLKSMRIVGANTGVASKDLSTLLIDNLYLEDCIKGFTAYQKKPEYGKATIIVKKYTAKNVKHLYLLDKGSILDLMGQKFTGEI